MTEGQERLSREIANEVAQSTVEAYHAHLPIGARLKLHARYYHAILGGIWAYSSVGGAMEIRDIAIGRSDRER